MAPSGRLSRNSVLRVSSDWWSLTLTYLSQQTSLG
jgi:hypothetical protein